MRRDHCIEDVAVVVPDTAPEHEIGVASDDVRRVELQIADIADDSEHAGARRPWTRAGEALAGDREAPRIARADAEWNGRRGHRTPSIGWSRTWRAPPDPLLHAGVLAVADARGESLPFLGRRVAGRRRDSILALRDRASVRIPTRHD